MGYTPHNGIIKNPICGWFMGSGWWKNWLYHISFERNLQCSLESKQISFFFPPAHRVSKNAASRIICDLIIDICETSQSKRSLPVRFGTTQLIYKQIYPAITNNYPIRFSDLGYFGCPTATCRRRLWVLVSLPLLQPVQKASLQRSRRRAPVRLGFVCCQWILVMFCYIATSPVTMGFPHFPPWFSHYNCDPWTARGSSSCCGGCRFESNGGGKSCGPCGQRGHEGFGHDSRWTGRDDGANHGAMVPWWYHHLIVGFDRVWLHPVVVLDSYYFHYSPIIPTIFLLFVCLFSVVTWDDRFGVAWILTDSDLRTTHNSLRYEQPSWQQRLQPKRHGSHGEFGGEKTWAAKLPFVGYIVIEYVILR